MGYYMNMVDCKIFIKNENKIKAMEAIKELVLNTDLNWVDFQTVTCYEIMSLGGGD